MKRERNDACTNAIPVNTFPIQLVQSTSVLTSVGDPVPSCGINEANGGWYLITPSTTGTLTIDSSGSNFNTVLAAYQGECGMLTELACDDNGSGSSAALLEMPVYVGEPVYILAGGFNGATGTLTLDLSITPASNACFSLLLDGDFEALAPNVDWTIQTSTQFGSVICDSSCSPTTNSAGPFAGNAWAWFGTDDGNVEGATLGQAVYLPQGTATLSFHLWIGTVSAPFTDNLKLSIDGTMIAEFPEPANVDPGYLLRSFDVSAFADGGVHDILFEYEGTGEGTSDYNVDNVLLEVCIDDLDGDGLPNDFETAEGLDSGNAADAGQDRDGDQMNHLEEYIAGTDIDNPDDFLRLLIEVPPSVGLSFDSVTGRWYSIDAATNVSSPVWNSVVTGLVGNGARQLYPHTNTVPGQVFRLNVQKAE